jgi:competence protein ComEC
MTDRTTPSRRWLDALARRPAVPAAGLFIAGIVMHPILPNRPLLWLGGAIGAAVIAMFLRRHRFGGDVLAAAILCCAVATAQIEAFQYSSRDISGYASDEMRLARIELFIDQPLRIIGTSFTTFRPMPPKQVTTARVVRVLTKNGWTDADGRVLVQIDPPNSDLALGQRIRAIGMLQRPSPAMNPGQFDWAQYYRQQRILASIQIGHSDAIQIVSRSSPSLLARARESVRRTLAAGFSREQSLDHALLRALVLGDNDPELRDVQEQFRRTGTSHHLAISGMHVAVLGAVVFWICHLLLIRPRAVATVGLIAVLLYGAVALPSPPVIRSVLLCTTFALGIMSRRSTDGIQLLSLSVLAMLVYEPLDIYNAGFQLSFGTVLGLMALTRRVMPLMRDPDANVALAAAYQLRPDPALRWKHRLRQWALAALVPAVIAWLVSLPLVAAHFEQLNPWAILASLLLAIPVFVALIGGFLKLALTALLPMWAGTWATCAAAPVSWMRQAVDALAMLPGSEVPLPSPALPFILLYYVMLCSPLFAGAKPSLGRKLRFAPIGAVLMIAFVPWLGAANLSPANNSLRVTLLAVGAGQCCVIEMPDGRTILLDAGSASLAEPVRKCIAPFLRHLGKSRIDEIWLSHGDYDHMSAASELIRTYGVSRVVISSAFERHASDNAPAETLLEIIRQNHVKLDHLRVGEHVPLGKDTSIDVLWPPEMTSFSSNNDGLVLKLTYARRTILFPADIQDPPEAALLKSPQSLRCDVLIAPHHGSSEATTARFVAAADPLYVISSNDRTLSQKQRQFERVIGERKLLRTNRCGSVTVQIDPTGGLTVRPFLVQSSPP